MLKFWRFSRGFLKFFIWQGNTSNSEIPIFFKPGLIERYNPVIKHANNISCPNSRLSDKSTFKVNAVKLNYWVYLPNSTFLGITFRVNVIALDEYFQTVHPVFEVR